MNCDDFDAAQFVEFEASSSSEWDEDFTTLYSSLENLVCLTEKKRSRTVTVTSEYVPSSVESSFELAEEHLTDFGNDPANPNVGETASGPEILACSAEKEQSGTVRVTSGGIPSLAESSFEPGKEENAIDFSNELANSNTGKTALDYLEKALSEFVQLQTNPQISSANLSKEIEKTCSEDTPRECPMNLPRDLTYRISSAVTPSSYRGSPLSKAEDVLLSSEDYESCLNRTGQDSLIGAMKSLQIQSARKIKRNREDFDGNSEIEIIVTPHEISEASDLRDENCKDQQTAPATETSLRSKSDMENLSSSANIADNRTTGRTYTIGEEDNLEITKTFPSHEIPAVLDFHDKNCEDEQSDLPTKTSLRSKLDMENLSSSANIAENRTTGRTCMIEEKDNSEIAKTVTSYEILEASDSRDKNREAEQSALATETSLRSKWDIENLLFLANIAENQTTGRTYIIGEEDNSGIATSVQPYGIPEASDFRDKNTEVKQSALPTETDIKNASSSTNIAENRTTGRTYIIGEEDNSGIATSVQPYGIPEASDFRDKNTEVKQSALPTETDMKNASSSTNIAENRTTGRTYIIGEEDNSGIATSVQPYGIPEASDFRDKNTEVKQSALPTEKDMKNASSSTNIAENRTTGRTLIIGEKDKSKIVETTPPYGIPEASSGIPAASSVLPDASSKSVHPAGVSAEQKKKRKNPRVLTSQVRRQSLKYRRSSGQFVSMAEAMLKFQKGTPKRFRSTIKKNQNRPAEPKIRSLHRATCPMSPALRCKSRARPSKLLNQEERAMLYIEESRRNRFKATKSPGPQKSTKEYIPPIEKSAPSSSKDSRLLSADELKILPRRATPRRKTLVKSVVSTEEGPIVEDVEIFNFGVPIQRIKSPLTKPEPFSFEKREKKMLEKRDEPGSAMMENEKRKMIRPGSAAAISTMTSGSLEGTARKPVDLTFWERNELLLAKKKLIAGRAREENQARVFHARLAPPVKQVLVRGTSTEHLGPAKVAAMLKQVPGRATSSENLCPAKATSSVKQVAGRGSSTENLGPTKVPPTMQTVPGRATSTDNLCPAKVTSSVKQVLGRGTSTENLGLTKVAPMIKAVPERGTLTENLGLPENKQKARGLSPTGRSRGLSPAERSRGLSPAERSRGLSPAERSRGLSPAERSRGLSPAERSKGLSSAGRSRGLSPAERSRGLSPAERSRGLSPAGRSRGLSPAERLRGLSPSITDRENRDPNVSSINNQCPKLKAPLTLYTEDRSKKRHEFDAAMRRKEEEAEQHRREYEAYRLAQEKKEEKELRRTMELRAKPMPAFKPPKIAKSLKPLTAPQSPAWSWKKTKK